PCFFATTDVVPASAKVCRYPVILLPSIKRSASATGCPFAVTSNVISEPATTVVSSARSSSCSSSSSSGGFGSCFLEQAAAKHTTSIPIKPCIIVLFISNYLLPV